VVELVIIGAVSKNKKVNGSDGFPWSIPEHRGRVESLISKSPIVLMGRKTFEQCGPWEQCLNIVISKETRFQSVRDRFFVTSNPINAKKLAFTVANSLGHPRVFLLGGPSLWDTFLPAASTLMMHQMSFDTDGSIDLPEFSEDIKEFESAGTEMTTLGDDASGAWVTLRRTTRTKMLRI